MMEKPKNFIGNILVAEDDPDDRLLVTLALEKAGFEGNLRFVNDGMELMKCLDCIKCQENTQAGPPPDVLFVNLNMLGKNDREALQDIKSGPDLHDIKLIALTGLERPDDAEIWHKIGAECLITKPDTYAAWVEMMGKVLGLMCDSPPKSGWKNQNLPR